MDDQRRGVMPWLAQVEYATESMKLPSEADGQTAGPGWTGNSSTRAGWTFATSTLARNIRPRQLTRSRWEIAGDVLMLVVPMAFLILIGLVAQMHLREVEQSTLQRLENTMKKVCFAASIT